MSEKQRMVTLGRISGLYGVRGWLKVYSYTATPSTLFDYPEWSLQGRCYRLIEGRTQGKGLVAKLEGVEDRDQAALLLDHEIEVPRSALPPAAPDEYYWSDLVGLQVITREGQVLGRIHHLFTTGANDVVVVEGERERLLPFIDGVILEVALEQGVMRVDWDPDF